METLVWCLMGPILLISIKAELHDYIPHSFHETPRSSSPSPLPSQAPPPSPVKSSDLIGMKEVVLLLTPDQVNILQEAGAVVRPYPEYKSGFDELRQQFQRNIQNQNEKQNKQHYVTISQNERPKLSSKLENYYKLLNIQQINDDLAQSWTTERTTIKITTTPRDKFTKSRQHYNDNQHLTANDPKKVSQSKFAGENTDMEYVRFLPDYENEDLKMVPYDALPLRPYRFDKVLANIYTQANDEAERNSKSNDGAPQNAQIQLGKEIQRNYTRVNKKSQRNEYYQRNKEQHSNASLQPVDEAQKSVSNKEARHDAFIQPSKDFQRNEYNLTNIEDQQNVYRKAPATYEIQRNVYRKLNKNFQRNKQTQANKAGQSNSNTKTIYESNQANHDAGRNLYKINKTQLNAYSKPIDEPQQNLGAILETQRIAYIHPTSKNVQQNAYTQVTEDTKQHANSKIIEKGQRNMLKIAQLTIKEESDNPQAIVEVPITKVKYNPVSTSIHLGDEDTTGFKETFKYIEGLKLALQQQEKEEFPFSPPPTVQTPSVSREKLSLLLAPLYQHHVISGIIAQQREELLNSEFKIQTRLQQIKHAPQHDHQEFTSELEKLTRNLGKQNALAKLEAISNSPTVFTNQETDKNRLFENVKNKFPILSSTLVRVQGPLEVNIPTSYLAPLDFIRSIPVPVLQAQNDEAGKLPFPVNRNVYDSEDLHKYDPVAITHKMPFDPITLPEHVTIIRPIWEH